MSRAVVGATVIQDYDLRVSKYVKGDGIVDNPFKGFSIQSGDTKKSLALVRLSGIGKSMFNGEERSKVGNLIIQQSGAVDNAKTPVLSMNNLNMTTFNVSIAISLLQTNDGKSLDLRYNSYFLKQEIIQDYVEEMTKISDSLNEEYVSDKRDKVIENLRVKYLDRINLPVYNTVGVSFTAEELESLLNEENTSDIEYVKNQLEILEHFQTLDEIGQQLSEIFTAISTDIS